LFTLIFLLFVQWFAELMREGTVFPPISVVVWATCPDGRYRAAASLLCGFTHIPVAINARR
jgi:hypothetical protein